MSSPELWSAVDDYLDDALVHPSDHFAHALAASEAAGLPAIAVTASQGKLLHLMARMCSARRILEIGTLGGYSTIWMARALPRDGRLVTIEYEPKHADVALSNLQRAGVSDLCDVRVGAALDVLASMHAAGEPAFDFIFIDADKVNYPGYFEWSLRLSHPGTVIVADNVIRDGKVADATSDDGPVKAVRRMFAMMADASVDATAIQTVGTKGYDGLSVAIVR